MGQFFRLKLFSGHDQDELLFQVRCIQLIDPDVDPEIIFHGAVKEEENDDDDEDVPVSQQFFERLPRRDSSVGGLSFKGPSLVQPY